MPNISFDAEQAKTYGLDQAIVLFWLEQALSCNQATSLQLNMDKLRAHFCFWDSNDLLDIFASLQTQQVIRYQIKHHIITVAMANTNRELPAHTIKVPVIASTPVAQPQATMPPAAKSHYPSYSNDIKSQNKADLASWECIDNHNPVQAPKKTHIFNGWQPSNDFFVSLQNLNIDRTFAVTQLPEFVLFHQNKQTQNDAWDSLFLGWVRTRWARQQQGQGYAKNQSVGEKQQLRSRISNVHDTDW